VAPYGTREFRPRSAPLQAPPLSATLRLLCATSLLAMVRVPFWEPPVAERRTGACGLHSRRHGLDEKFPDAP